MNRVQNPLFSHQIQDRKKGPSFCLMNWQLIEKYLKINQKIDSNLKKLNFKFCKQLTEL